MKKYDVIVVGGGAAGMMAAIAAAKEGAKTALLEKNEKLGKKIYITGKDAAISRTPVRQKSSFLPSIPMPNLCIAVSIH